MSNGNSDNITTEETREWMYDAFISYRHIEPDAFVAGTIHKLLESYNPPKSIFKGKAPEEIKRTKIKKVFRDQEELPLTSNLSDTIGLALENSEYLIVICSPRFGESLWCEKEVETFISLHGKEKVLTVLVDGEPAESFPEALLYREIEVTKEDGTTEIIKEPIEPLAANARGNSNKERYKLLKTESLRLMAPMFGVNFDDLKQRHKEQRLRRIVSLVAAIAGACFLFGVVSTSMALKISNQNKQITEQNQQILQQNNQISAQADQIKAQYDEALISNGKAVTQLAQSLYNDGDRVEAIKKAYGVFPNANNQVPFIQSTQKVLTDALAVYDYGDSYLPDRILRAGSVINECVVSPNGKAVAVTDEAFGIYVWDANSGKVLLQKSAGDALYSNSFNVTFKNDTQIYTMIDDSFVLYDFEKDEVVFEFEKEGRFKSVYNADLDRVVVYGYDEIYLADGSTGKIIESTVKSEGDFWSNDIIAVTEIKNSSQNYYAYALGALDDTAPKQIIVRKLDDGTVVKEYELYLSDISKIKIYGEQLLMLENVVPDDYLSNMDESTFVSNIYCYDFINGTNTPKWCHEVKGSYGNDIAMSGTGLSVGCTFYSSLEVINAENGELERKYSTDEQIQSLMAFVDDDSFAIVTRKGVFYTASPDFNDLLEASFFHANVENLKLFDVRGGVISTVPYGSTELTLHKTIEQSEREIIYNADDFITEMECSEDGTKLMAYVYGGGSVTIDRQSAQSTPGTDEYDGDESEEVIQKKDQYIENLQITKKAVSSSVLDPTERLFVVSYKDRSFDVYRIDSSSNVIAESKEHFNALGLFNIKRIEANQDGNMVWIDGSTCSIILDLNEGHITDTTPSESMIVTVVNKCKYVDFDNRYIYFTKNGEISRFPLYSKEDIAVFAAQEIAANE